MLIFAHYAMLQCSKIWLIMLNIMLKNKNCAQHIILINYIQVCINKSLFSYIYITDNFRKTATN